MPEFHIPKGRAPRNFDALADFMRGYVKALFFTNTGPDNEDMEGKTFDDLAPETVATIAQDCDRFQRDNAITLQAAYARCEYTEEQAGQDFWFTRNGHGVGFWDRIQLNRDNIDKNLTAGAKYFPPIDPYVGDDGRIYLI